MASREKELIFHKGHQKGREMLCRSLLGLRHLWTLLKMLLQALDVIAVWCFFLILSWAFFALFFLGLSHVKMLCRYLLPLRHLWSPLKMFLQALDGTTMWCFFLTLWWAFFSQFFLGLSQVTCWSLIFLCFLLILFECWQFSLTLTTMIAYCPHKASGEGGLVHIWTPNQELPNHTFKPLGYLNIPNHLQASLSYIFTLLILWFGCLDKNNTKWSHHYSLLR